MSEWAMLADCTQHGIREIFPARNSRESVLHCGDLAATFIDISMKASIVADDTIVSVAYRLFEKADERDLRDLYTKEH